VGFGATIPVDQGDPALVLFDSAGLIDIAQCRQMPDFNLD